MTVVSADLAGCNPAGTLDQRGNISSDGRWRSLRTVLDTGGLWVLVEPCGAIRATGVHLDHVIDRIGEDALVDLVGPRALPPVLRAIAATAAGEGPVRLRLDPTLTLNESVTVAEMVFTELPIDVGFGAVIVQLVEATTSDGETINRGGPSRESDLESALRRIHDLVLQFRSHHGLDEDDLPTIAEPLPDSLSSRRHEVATAVLGGASVKDIAVQLGLSPHTIRNHLKVVYRQLGVSSRAELQRRFHP